MTLLSMNLTSPASPTNKENIKIAFVCNSAWGVYNFRLGVINALQSKGIKILVIAPHDAHAEKLKSENCDFIDMSFDSKGSNPIKDFVSYLKLKKIYKAEKPSFIFHYTIKPNIYGTYAAKSAGIPSIALVTGLGYVFGLNNLLSNLVKVLYRRSLSHARKTWFLNDEDFSYFVNKGIVSPTSAEILRSEGVNTEQFSPRTVETSDSKFTVILVARMLWNKGIGEFVEAARILRKRHSDMNFQLLGFLGVDNPESITEREMNGWVDEGSVSYLGVSDDVAAHVAKADCVVLPSFYREGVPRVLMEAASMEKPIVTTDNVGCREVVDDGHNGYLCKTRDAEDLAAKIEKLYSLGDDERLLMGKNGRKKMINEFDEKLIIQKYFDALNEHFSGIG